MKTLKFIIPRTAESITALISSLNDEIETLGGISMATSDDSDIRTHTAPTPASDDIAPAGVELDEDGIPWDPRIHSSKKTKLVKGNTWKVKRGVDGALVDTVIAELKATMTATGASDTAPPPVASAPAPAPAPAVVEPDPIYIVEGSGEFTAEALFASGWTNDQIETLPVKPVEQVVAAKTFPELMAAITAAGLDEATVLAAVVKQGIQATPLLAARPDLVPAVYADLFPA